VLRLLSVSGVKCSVCSNVFYSSCAKLINNVISIDENTVKCCVNDSELFKTDSPEGMLYDALTEIADKNNKFDMKLIQYILNQKDFIISELWERIDILKKHVNLLNIHYQATSNVNNNGYEHFDTAERHDPRLLTLQESSDTFYRKLEYIGSKQQTWSEVVRKKTKRITVIGKKANNDASVSKLHGVPKYVPLHVYRLAPETKTDEVIEFIKPSFPEVKVEKLTSRHPELYSSFKVDIYAENIDYALDSLIWPENSCIRRFLCSKTKENSDRNQNG
ncbi:hypothetical protein ANN_08977, partial [Periplaneta americana]